MHVVVLDDERALRGANVLRRGLKRRHALIRLGSKALLGERLPINHPRRLGDPDWGDSLLRGISEARHVSISQHRLPLLEGVLLIAFMLQAQEILILQEEVPRAHRDLRGGSVIGGETWDLDIREVSRLLAWLGRLLVEFVIHLMQLLIEHGSVVEGAHGGHHHVA